MKLIYIFCAIAVIYLIALAESYADYRHSKPIANVSNITYNETRGIASAIAASQHHYKATTALQWSVGGGNYNGDSAVSFGLGKQAGKIFVSGNFSSDGRASAIGFGASGTF